MGAEERPWGFAKLPNALNERGILAHLEPKALKVYLAILLASRSRTFSCFPCVETLARWSGVPRGQISEATDYLERHKLIVKGWLKVRGNPRRAYRVIQPTDPMYPDHRESCVACMSTDHRESCVVRDPLTGRLQGRRCKTASTPLQSVNTDHRDSGNTYHRDSCMSTDHRDTNQTEADEKVLNTREGGCRGEEQDAAARFASPSATASVAASTVKAEPAGEQKAALEGKNGTRAENVRTLLEAFSGDRKRTASFARKAGYSEPEIAAALGEEPARPVAVDRNRRVEVDLDRRCEATTKNGLACVSRPIIGSPFCRWHQTREAAECLPVG
jgi:hypothetical protein